MKTPRFPSALAAGATLLVMSAFTYGEDSHFKHHTVGVFLGDSDERSGGDHFTVGVEYEYKFNPKFGAGVVFETTDGAHDGDGVSVGLAALYYHPYAGWRLGAGLGTEKIHGSHGGYESLYRVGVAYDFHVGKFGIAPDVSLDRVDGENILVYGLVFSYGF
ncbi:MAG: hypothetical protein ABJK25_04105 [Halieaceae bacterium]